MQSEKADKYWVILDAALKVLAENGFHGAPTSLIAQEAGVGVGTIYRYFRDKDELIRVLFREIQGRTYDRIFGDEQEELPLRERFILIFSRLLRFFLESPREFKFMEQYYYSPFSTREEGGDQKKDAVKRLLTSGREQQIIKDAPLPVLEAIAFGPVVALAKEHSNRNLPVDETMVRRTVEACWDGLKR